LTGYKINSLTDHLDHKYGKHTVFLGSSFVAMQGNQHAGDWGELPRRK